MCLHWEKIATSVECSETSRKTAPKSRAAGQPQEVTASFAGSPRSYGVGARIQYDVVRRGEVEMFSLNCFSSLPFHLLSGLPFHLLSGVLLMEM